MHSVRLAAHALRTDPQDGAEWNSRVSSTREVTPSLLRALFKWAATLDSDTPRR